MAIIENQKVKVKWNGSNRKHYEKLGYTYTKNNDEFEIPIEYLPKKSHTKVKIKCDWCEKENLKRRDALDLNGNHFCNNKCFGLWLSLTEEGKKITDKRRTSIKTNCGECGKDVYKKPSEFKGHGLHFCSRECSGLYNSRTNPYLIKTTEKISVKCEYCKTNFEKHESKIKNNKWFFCSRECYANFRSENLKANDIHNYQGLLSNCDNCDCEIKTTKYKLENSGNKFCSQECYYEFRSKHYIGENHPQFGVKKTPEQIEEIRIRTANMIANGMFPQTNTSIQIKINKINNELGFDFEEEIQFKYYVLDFYSSSKNLAIEVMGDYWHANPQKYDDYSTLHDIQKKDIIRDKSKKTYLKKYHDINILYVWEKDINKNPELCKELIKYYYNNNGLIQDYNSFNYFLNKGSLELNEKIILPFFMKSNTPHQTC